jgi:HNH endonuclease
MTQKQTDLFLSKLVRWEGGGCWFWTGALDPKGYGRVTVDGRTWFAHRLCWTIFVGPLSENESLLHSCDNPQCVNINHLKPGTQQDNIDDMVSRGRMPRGSARAHAKLSESAVVEILKWRGKMSYTKIAALFGTSRSVVGTIMIGKSWKHVKI